MNTTFVSKRNVYLALTGILILGALLRFWGIGTLDVQHDHAINSYRALGWLDYLGDKQTSPIIWFKDLPWWTHLSFHDHPPLSFGIQYVTFALLGDNGVSAHLPFILGGLAAIVIIFFVARREFGDTEGLIAAFLYAISSYAIWTSRTGYLEGLEVAFIMATVLYLFRFLRTGSAKASVLWGLFLGLSLLTKYTSIFLIPAALIALVLWRRHFFKKLPLWIGACTTLALLTPLIIYNVFTFMTRGHFDAALSSMIGLHPADFGGIASRGVNINILTNIGSIANTLFNNISLPLLLLALTAVYVLIRDGIQKQGDRATTLLLIHAGLIVVLFSFSGTQTRFLSIIMPFIAILTAHGLVSLFTRVTSRRLRKAMVGIVAVILVGEFLFALNTNILAKPIGTVPYLFSRDRVYDAGYEQLDRYLRTHAYGQLPSRKGFTAISDTYLPIDFKEGNVIILDERIDWFAKTWYIRRYQHYYKLPIIDLTYLAQLFKKFDIQGELMTNLGALGAKELWFIRVTEKTATSDLDASYAVSVQALATRLEDAGVKPVLIKNKRGTDSFMVYHFWLQ